MEVEKQKIIQKGWFKNLILIGFPATISAIGVIITLVPTLPETIKNTLIILIIFSIFIHIWFVMFFSKQEEKIFGENKKLTTILAHCCLAN